MLFIPALCIVHTMHALWPSKHPNSLQAASADLLCIVPSSAVFLLLQTFLQAELAALRQALSAAFAAAPRGPAYVDALQQLAAADRSLWINPDHLLQAAEASGGLGAAAVQVEEQMMYAGTLLLLLHC